MSAALCRFQRVVVLAGATIATAQPKSGRSGSAQFDIGLDDAVHIPSLEERFWVAMAPQL